MANLEKLNFKPTDDPSKAILQLAMSARIPAAMIGDPGTTKTAVVNSITQDIDYELITLILSRVESPDISGFPAVGQYKADDPDFAGNGAEKTFYAPQEWQHRIMEHKKVVLFFDEYSNASPSVHASALSMIQDRQFPNGDKFPDEVIIVLAMNPSDSAADFSDLSPATTNRMMMIRWHPSRVEWQEGMKVNWGKKTPPKEMEWRKLIVRFIEDNPDALHNLKAMTEFNQSEASLASFGLTTGDSVDETALRYAWPSRRSWDNLAVVLGQMEKQNSVFEDMAASGLVGYSAASRFRIWLNENLRLDLDSIWEDPRAYDGWDSMSVDDLNMVMRALTERTSESIDNVKTTIEVLSILSTTERAPQVAPFVLTISKKINIAAVDAKLTREERNELNTAYTDQVKNYSIYLKGGKKAPSRS